MDSQQIKAEFSLQYGKYKTQKILCGAYVVDIIIIIRKEEVR
jgi:hypothetical protein